MHDPISVPASTLKRCRILKITADPLEWQVGDQRTIGLSTDQGTDMVAARDQLVH
jgi:hypothetical protein